MTHLLVTPQKGFSKDWSIANTLFNRSVLWSENGLQRKKWWSVVSGSKSQEDVGSMESLKLRRTLCSFKWLKFNLKRVSSLRSDITYCIDRIFSWSNTDKNFFFWTFLLILGMNAFTFLEPFLGAMWKVRTFRSISTCTKLFYIGTWFWFGLVVLLIMRA